MIRFLSIGCLFMYVNCQNFGDLPPDIQAVIGRTIPGNGNGPFIALGGAGIGEAHSNGLRNGWDGNPATRGMPQTGMHDGFHQHDPGMMQGGFDNGMMQRGLGMPGGFQQNQFDLPLPIDQGNIGGRFVGGFSNPEPRMDIFPGQDSFVPLSSVVGGSGSAIMGGGYGRRHLPKKPIIDPKTPIIHPKKPVIHPKKPIIPSKISYAKKPVFNQGSPIIFPQLNPVIQPKIPIHPKKPIIHHKRPITYPKRPIISPVLPHKMPIRYPKKSILPAKKPIIQPKNPMIYPRIPSVLPVHYPKNPMIYPKNTVISPKKSIIHPKKPIIQPKRLGGHGRRRTFGGY